MCTHEVLNLTCDMWNSLFCDRKTNKIVKVILCTSAKIVPKTTGFAEKGAHCSAMSQEKIPYFRTAITAIFKNWTALQLAVNHVSCFGCWKLSSKSAFCNIFLSECWWSTKQGESWMDGGIPWILVLWKQRPWALWGMIIFQLKLTHINRWKSSWAT